MKRRVELPNANDIEGLIADDRLMFRKGIRTGVEDRRGLRTGVQPRDLVERPAVKGFFQAVLTRPDGSVLYHAQPNLIVSSGWDLLCNVLGLNAQPSDLTHIAVGTGTTAAAAADTALETELARLTATYAHTAGTMACTFSRNFGAGQATGALTEAGLFNAASAGTMFNRVVYDVINKQAGDTLAMTFTITFAAG